MKNPVNIKILREELGLTIRRKRHKLNLSQESLADKANIHRTYVSSIELGKIDVSVSIAYRISRALDIPLSKIIKETEKNIPADKDNIE